ncbi:hypothetical protein [Algibacter sp. 2305UL17-15]|uniref:hypothetical protein n=1 Tax=Algibacter sp. 2305UL17-15 TaxID=3231268 RepID=UPI003458A58E
MKANLKIVLISLLLSACSGGESGDDTPPVSKNNIPTTPILVYPTNNLLCIDNTLEFEWNT